MRVNLWGSLDGDVGTLSKRVCSLIKTAQEANSFSPSQCEFIYSEKMVMEEMEPLWKWNSVALQFQICRLRNSGDKISFVVSHLICYCSQRGLRPRRMRMQYTESACTHLYSEVLHPPWSFWTAGSVWRSWTVRGMGTNGKHTGASGFRKG